LKFFFKKCIINFSDGAQIQIGSNLNLFFLNSAVGYVYLFENKSTQNVNELIYK
jgi:hypothetical protein